MFNTKKIAELQTLCANANRITIVSHTNPDGDAIGSGLALLGFLRARGFDARFYVPNRFPKFLDFITGSSQVGVYGEICGPAHEWIVSSELIICVDFNQVGRLEKMTEAIQANTTAPRVLIDHHLDPPQGYDLAFSDNNYCSTAQIIYDLICAWGGPESIDYPIAEAIYTGIITDTGNLSFGHLTPAVYQAVALLVERGVKPYEISRSIFNTQSESRLRMVGHLISEKMTVFPELHTAYMTLTRSEKQRFNHQIGDTEGIVNMPLTIDGVNFSAMFIETLECIKISFRSQGNFDVNHFANSHFNGGGHRNAAGGRFYGTMQEAIELFTELIKTIHP